MRYAELIAVGSELLVGGRLDTNSLFLTDRLGALGIEVRWKSIVGDDERDIADALRASRRRAEVILVTGGLGPTRDDLTREAVARAAGRPLRRRPDAVDALVARLKGWGRTPAPRQLRQAFLPKGTDLLENPIGTAPGFSFRWNGRFVAVLPGVPREAEQMFDAAVVPKLIGGSDTQVDRRVIHTFGLIEAEVDRRLDGLFPRRTGISLGFLASPLGVLVSVTAVGRPSAIGPRLDKAVATIKRRLGRSVFAEGAKTMEEVVGLELARRGLTLAVAESCTGGLIGHRLTQVPGSSAYFDRGVICYSNAAKTALLGVPETVLMQHGAVSAEVALAMAKGARIRSGTHIGLSVTGIAGPGGGSERKPVGLVYVGLDARGSRGMDAKSIAQEYRFHGDRATIKMRAAQAALNLLRERLMDAMKR
jgi:nicotinamide-nucleotide amidase